MRRILANGISTAYQQIGSGPPLLLIHGAEADSGMFLEFAPELANEFTVITYDQRDCGHTENPDSAYTMADLAGDAAALVTELGYGRVHVLGSSFGGALAQELALLRPELVDRLVLAMTLQKMGVPAPSPETIALFRAVAAGDTEGIRAAAELYFSARAVARDPTLVTRLQRLRPARTPAQAQRRGAVAASFNTLGRLSAVEAPTLILAGRDDRIVPPAAPWAMAGEIPSATFVMLDGVGHVWTLECPARVAALTRQFLNSTL